MIHIVTPFSRWENLNFYVEGLKNQNIVWHPIYHSEGEIPNVPWIQPFKIKVPEGWDACYYKLNYFMDTAGLVANDYYLFMNDDDWFEEGFFDKIRQNSDELLIVSMKRGHNHLPHISPHGTSNLYANQQSMCVGSVGVEQIVIKGSLLSRYRFPNSCVGDGILISQITGENKAKFLPDCYAYFNYLQEGRWNK